jgi:hypothetical protein
MDKKKLTIAAMPTSVHLDYFMADEVNNNRLWQVDLTLTNNSDPQLHLMIKLSQYSNAEELYHLLLDHTFDDRKLEYIYHQFGKVKMITKENTYEQLLLREIAEIDKRNFSKSSCFNCFI